MFYSASLTILRNESDPGLQAQHGRSTGLNREEWMKAVIKGADEKSPRWRHLLPIGGLLYGFEGEERQGLSRGPRLDLEGALIKATNLALSEIDNGGAEGGHCITLVLNHTFEVLSEGQRRAIDYDNVLPVLVGTALFSLEGFQSAYFLRAAEEDIVQSGLEKFTWSARSPSFIQMQKISSKPLIASMGPLSRLIAHSVEHVTDVGPMESALHDMTRFSQDVVAKWRQNKLSEIDVLEESLFLDEDALKATTPMLWQMLKKALFTTVIILRSIVARTLGDPALANDQMAPFLATRTLHILRNLYFISSRLGSNAFSNYTFVSLTAIDILSKYPDQARAFLYDIRPSRLEGIPSHPLDRCNDLYFLNTGEHFSTVLSSQESEELLLTAAMPYLTSDGDPRLLEIFEAAHSNVLAILSAPQNADLTARALPSYVNTLFRTFPQNLSSRQFRLAFKTLVRIASPPFPLSGAQPDLSATLLELLRYRALHAPTVALSTRTPTSSRDKQASDKGGLSQQAIFTLTLLDCLSVVSHSTLKEWLPLAAEQVNWVKDTTMARTCKERFWEVLSSGDMDVERAEICVTWWSTRGGRESVLYGLVEAKDGHFDGPFMSGGLGERSQL
ncbi:MAG: hypothetical protein M1837_006213 [Sclerophora amabilis]|nr:MAG: hypothetical protein M1837_006213 [Sclerophora amabilis]